MDLRILSIDQWARSRTRKRTDKCKDCTHMVTTPDEDQSTVFINKNRQRFTIPHTNGLAKCRCSHPNAPKKVHSHVCSEEFDCYNSCHATWSEAYRLVRMPNAPELRLHDPLDPENLPKTDRRDVLARNWTKEWANLDKSPAKKRAIRFPVFPKQPCWTGK